MDQALKMFNCTACGPVEVCYVHGEWVNVAYADAVFAMTRPSFEEFIAELSPRGKAVDPAMLPKALADVEFFAEEQKKFQCSRCGKTFVIPHRKIEEAGTVAAGPAVLAPAQYGAGPIPYVQQLGIKLPGVPQGAGQGVGQNRPGVEAIISQIDDGDLDTILIDLGFDPANYPTHADKVAEITDRLYM